MKIEKLVPAYRDYLWGGVKLREVYGKEGSPVPCAESWELSFHKDGLTCLSDGRALADAATLEDWGENAKDFPFFPVLVKFIDAKDNLSVQVHPSDDYALSHENSYGKTEMWYIVEADEGAGIYLGFQRDVTQEEYELAIAEQRLTDLLNFYEVRAGECYFIPSGTVHAIGKGCLICEIQQNSNLTYRVYDYGRKDKNGRERELHIDKALRVSHLSRYEHIPMEGDLLGVSKYFQTRRLHVSDEVLCADEKSFQCLTCVSGVGEIDGQRMTKGDSFFVPANFGKYHIKGNMEVILVEIRKYYIGIDLGGTFIKGGVTDDTGRIIVSNKVPTEAAKGDKAVASNIAELCKALLAEVNMTSSDVVGIGIGVPGMIDSAKGEVVYSNNLAWEHFEIAKTVEEMVGIPVRIANDANVAALGEAKFGCGKGAQNTIMLTLGTGVGGGMVLDGKLYEGNRSAGAELGHSVIVAGGEQCTCGRKGCLEAYASATALIRDTKRAMEQHPETAMWQIGSIDAVNGKTAFDYKDSDPVAAEVVQNYLEKLAVGIVNLANELRPEKVILGGGICAEGDRLIVPLQKLVDSEIYAGSRGPKVELVIATLGNSAGILGASALWL